MTEHGHENEQTSPTRRSMREHTRRRRGIAPALLSRTRRERSGASDRLRATARWAPRVAVLGSLAVATTAIPLSGAASEPEQVVATFAPATVLTTSSALDVLSGHGPSTSATAGADALAADPLAEARAVVSASRSQDRDTEVLECGSGELEANGALGAGAETESVDVIWPLETGTYRLTSGYGPRWGSMHEGTDFAAPRGTPIHAVADGEVTYVGFGLAGRSGMIMVLQHVIDGETLYTWYVHSYPDGVFVSPGDQVSAGDVIGEVGSYGNSTGNHLHFEVHTDARYTTINSLTWLQESGAAEVTPENLACAAGG